MRITNFPSAAFILAHPFEKSWRFWATFSRVFFDVLYNFWRNCCKNLENAKRWMYHDKLWYRQVLKIFGVKKYRGSRKVFNILDRNSSNFSEKPDVWDVTNLLPFVFSMFSGFKVGVTIFLFAFQEKDAFAQDF